MKMRLDIDFKAKMIKNDNGTYAHHFITLDSSMLLKYVSYVIIDGKKYNKPGKDSKEVQNYYYFIVKNKMKITELMMSDGKHCFLKEGKYHSYDTYCFYNPKLKVVHYAINGEILTPEESKIFELRKKLVKLIKQSK